ncbi:hypothetical protein XU18_4323 [Perkinsela sp. CCAP 1560/4]|nr:hypothetical protein XU18_4323 [Perkinsela sp. CCAP 1560/4]|eukprot:KNH04464.1 hypothetical protein XU18_4323 [Perkinsela sp. CCAP 1560/4]
MKAYRALTGDAIYGPELEFLQSIQRKFKYQSPLWIRSNDMRCFSGVHIDPKEKGHLYVNSDNEKYSYIVYNADQLLNSQKIQKDFDSMRKSSMRTERHPWIKGTFSEKEDSEINIEFDKFMEKLRQN